MNQTTALGHTMVNVVEDWEISTASIRRTVVIRVNTASLIFEGRLVLPVHVNDAITKGEANRLVLVLNVRKRLKARILDYLFELVTKKIDYHLFGVEVEFHREMITSQLQGKLWLYDEVHT
ncbi:hypothetical protein Tco_0772576 [Tanacetum coccineum]|uniref:Uncharacterized protein n=1 Tax=Tanacetum coccineum TaxID=301880 RepID=A0ABQ4ZIG2_9ASTR